MTPKVFAAAAAAFAFAYQQAVAGRCVRLEKSGGAWRVLLLPTESTNS